MILPHNVPDPDAVASAVALRYMLSEAPGGIGRIVYHGIIGRAENRALLRFLDHPLQPLKGSDLRQSVRVAPFGLSPEDEPRQEQDGHTSGHPPKGFDDPCRACAQAAQVGDV